MNPKICVAGKICSGKSTLTRAISSHINFPIVSFGGILRNYSLDNGLPIARKDLQEFGQNLIDQLGFEGFLRWSMSHSVISWDNSIIIDGLRHREIYGHILQMFPQTFLVYCDCDLKTQTSRLMMRDNIGEIESKRIILHKTELGVEELRAVAHLIFRPDYPIMDFLDELDDLISQVRK